MGCSSKRGKATINKAFAGAGIPLKSYCCSESILNFANRIAAPREIKNPNKAKGAKEKVNSFQSKIKLKSNSLIPISRNNLYMTIPGANPLVIRSAIESNWSPN